MANFTQNDISYSKLTDGAIAIPTKSQLHKVMHTTGLQIVMGTL